MAPQLKDLGYQIITINPDRPTKLRETVAQNNFDFTFLSDSKLAAARAFGLAFKVDDPTVARYWEKFKIDLEDASGEKHHLLPVPAVFITGTDGTIKFAYINPQYKVRPPADLVLAMAKAALTM